MEYDYICYFHGVCEPTNPGGALGLGAVIVDANGEVMDEMSKHVTPRPDNTNILADYQAFGCLLVRLISVTKDKQKILIQSDSKMVINQMNGSWQIKKGSYYNSAIKAKELLALIKEERTVVLTLVDKDKNETAVTLSRKAL